MDHDAYLHPLPLDKTRKHEVEVQSCDPLFALQAAKTPSAIYPRTTDLTRPTNIHKVGLQMNLTRRINWDTMGGVKGFGLCAFEDGKSLFHLMPQVHSMQS